MEDQNESPGKNVAPEKNLPSFSFMLSNAPNVIFILADDLGWGDLACTGNPFIRTPHLDRLAREGLSFTQHYSASPICAPARAGLLTGCYPHRTGAVDVPSNRGLDRISLRYSTLAEDFLEAGYATGLVGKWHNGAHDRRYHPRNRGFQEFTGFCNGGMDYWKWQVEQGENILQADGRYLTDVFTRAAVDFVHNHKEEPFFLFLTYNAPHAPFQAPEERFASYREQFPELTDEVCLLYAMIEVMDEGIGEVLQVLEDLHLAEDTLVVFSSDNGPYLQGNFQRFNGSLRGEKGGVYEGGIHVPALARWKGKIPGGVASEATTHFCDWRPTLDSVCALSSEKDFCLDGIDLSPLLEDPEAILDSLPPRFWQRNRYAPIDRCNGAIRQGPWKLVWPMREGGDGKLEEDQTAYEAGLEKSTLEQEVTDVLPDRELGPPSPPELFRLDQDPEERRNRAADHPSQVEQMVDQWDAWFQGVTENWSELYRENCRGE